MHPSHAFVQAPTRGSRELEDKPKAQHPTSFEQYATALHFAQRSGGGIRVTLQCALLQNSVRLAGLSARPRPSGSMRTDQRPVPASKPPALPCLPLCSGARTSEWTLTRAPSQSMLSEPACMPTICASVLLFLHPCPRVKSPPRAHAQRHQNGNVSSIEILIFAAQVSAYSHLAAAGLAHARV